MRAFLWMMIVQVTMLPSTKGKFSHHNDQCRVLTPFQSSLNTHYLTSLDDSRSTLPRALKGMSITSERHERHMSSDSSRRNPRPLPRHERYIYTYRLLANGAPLHFLISCANQPLIYDFWLIRISPQRRTWHRKAKAGKIYFPSLLESKWHRTIVMWTYYAVTQSWSTAVKFRRFVREHTITFFFLALFQSLF